MVILVKFFGILIAAMGIMFMASSKTLERYMAFWRSKKRLFIGGIVSILFGVVFLLAAPQCRLSGLITVFGVWAIVKGVLLFMIPQDKITAYLDWWMKKPNTTIRLLGLFSIAIGILFIYAA